MKYLQLIEGYGPKKLSEDGWPFDRLCTAYDYFGRNRIESKSIKKLMIHFVESKGNNAPNPLLGVLSKFETVSEPRTLVQIERAQDKFRFCFPYLQTAMQQFAADYCGTPAAVDQLNDEILSTNFIFGGCVTKSKNKNAIVSLNWSLERELRYAVEIQTGGDKIHIPVAQLQVRVINHKKIFSKIQYIDESIRIDRPGTKDYWLIDLKTGGVDFHLDRAAQGNAHGQYDLAQIYWTGVLVPKDVEKAIYWLELAALQKFQRAQALIEKILSETGT
ncbi:MAG: SEL1-like repeat protein [Methylophilaceae bacterium]